MRAAVIIARFPSGWKLLQIGEDTAAMKTAFKAIKIAGTHTVGEESADCALYLDAHGDARRKMLNDPDTAARMVAANDKAAADAADAAQKAEDAKAQADGSAKAKAIAQKAVAVIAAEVAAVSAPTAAKPADAKADPAADDSDAAEDDPAARFGGKKKR